MRIAALILSCLLTVASLLVGMAPAVAAPSAVVPVANPPLRYSIEIPPGQSGTPSAAPSPDTPSPAPDIRFRTRTASAEPVANPPLRYSVEADGPRLEPSAPPASLAQPAPASPAASAPAASAPVAPAPPAAKAAKAAPQQISGQVPEKVSTKVPEKVSEKVSGQVPEQVTVTANSAYRLGPGDKVHVTVYGEADLTGDFEISGSGRLAFPLIGDVQAAGLTAPQLGAELTKKLAAGYLLEPRVAVAITTYRPFYIIGQVNKPGRYPYAEGMTVVNAVALAGGFTPSAVESDVYVRHEGQTTEERLPVDDTAEIEPGDVVRVKQSGFWSFMSILSPLTAAVANARYGIP